jgi:hypothetical protein
MAVVDTTVTEVHVYHQQTSLVQPNPHKSFESRQSFERSAFGSTYKTFPPLLHICRLGNVSPVPTRIVHLVLCALWCSHSPTAEMLLCIAGLLPTLWRLNVSPSSWSRSNILLLNVTPFNLNFQNVRRQNTCDASSMAHVISQQNYVPELSSCITSPRIQWHFCNPRHEIRNICFRNLGNAEVSRSYMHTWKPLQHRSQMFQEWALTWSPLEADYVTIWNYIWGPNLLACGISTTRNCNTNRH